MSERIPCADCPDVIPIGKGEGICDKWDYRNPANVKIVKLFDVAPYCPKERATGRLATKSSGAK